MVKVKKLGVLLIIPWMLQVLAIPEILQAETTEATKIEDPRKAPVKLELKVEVLRTKKQIYESMGDPLGVSLSWAVPPGVPFSRFNIFKDGMYYASTFNTSYTDEKFKEGMTYTYFVCAVDADGFATARTAEEKVEVSGGNIKWGLWLAVIGGGVVLLGGLLCLSAAAGSSTPDYY